MHLLGDKLLIRCVIDKFAIAYVSRRLAIEVNANDSSYMPQKITVQGGISPEAVTDLCTVSASHVCVARLVCLPS